MENIVLVGFQQVPCMMVEKLVQLVTMVWAFVVDLEGGQYLGPEWVSSVPELVVVYFG